MLSLNHSPGIWFDCHSKINKGSDDFHHKNKKLLLDRTNKWWYYVFIAD